jgi:hypothetical protein
VPGLFWLGSCLRLRLNHDRLMGLWMARLDVTGTRVPPQQHGLQRGDVFFKTLSGFSRESNRAFAFWKITASPKAPTGPLSVDHPLATFWALGRGLDKLSVEFLSTSGTVFFLCSCASAFGESTISLPAESLKYSRSVISSLLIEIPLLAPPRKRRCSRRWALRNLCPFFAMIVSLVVST